jgi:hypothetical protein
MAGSDALPAARPKTRVPAPTLIAVLLAALVLALGALSLQLGQDLNFDLLNYHYYTGYAFLHGRTFHDIAPAGSQSFQPPLIHVLHYVGIAHLPPRVFGFVLGILHGLNLPLVCALGLAVLRGPGERRRTLVALAAALVGSAGPAAVSLLGTTFGDNLVSLPALLALVLLIRHADTPPGPGLALVVGFLAGAATGLKLTMAAYHVGLLVAAAILWWPASSALNRLGLFALGSVLGFLPTGGFWDFQLWTRFENPVFPFANGLFHSAFQSAESFRDLRYAVRTPYDLLRPFVDTALGRPDRLLEIGMRDARFLLLLLAGSACAVAWLVSRARSGRVSWTRPEAVLAAWWLASYLAWALAFYTYRYAALLEFTAPLLLFVLVSRLLPARPALWFTLAAALLILATTRAESWGRRAWQSPWLGLPIPPLGQQPGSLVLMVGQPSAFAIPSFPSDARFVNLSAVERFRAPEAWSPLVEQAVREHRGPLLLLSNFEFSRADCEARVEALGLRATPLCEPVRNGSLRFRLCELERK